MAAAITVRPFIPANYGAIFESLMESEFFGYKKGAFIDADKNHDGFILTTNGEQVCLIQIGSCKESVRPPFSRFDPDWFSTQLFVEKFNTPSGVAMTIQRNTLIKWQWYEYCLKIITV